MGFIASATRIWLTRSFRPFEFTNEYDHTLQYTEIEKLGLYVHIPFCRTLCDFCPYCKVLYDKDLARRYIDALIREIDLVGSASGHQKTTVSSLYFGGGSPALLIDDIERVVNKLRDHFIISEGIGIELHPQDVNEQTLLKLQQAGVTKISIGIQSFQSEYLAMLGRVQAGFDYLFDALAKIRFETVSMDFIFSLPGQTIESLSKDIDMAFQNGANHIAIYPFIDFTFTDRNFPKMRERDKKKLLYQMVQYCEEKGYARDSIWTFSKNGQAKYSSMTRENFLGFGCSATTLLKDQFKINTFGIEQYIDRIQQQKLPTALTLKFSLRQRMVYYLFWTAYTMRLDADSFHDFFGYELEAMYGLELQIARIIGLVKKEKNIYSMTTKGSYYYHYFEHFYTLSYIDQMWNLMSRQPFPAELIIG